MDSSKVKEWIELRKKQAALENELADVKEDAENLSLRLLEDFATDGIDQMKMDGITVFVQEKKYAGVAYLPNEDTDTGYDRACSVLAEVGLGHLVHRRFMTQSLSSWVNKNTDSIPKEFDGVIRITTEHKLVPRGVKKKLTAAEQEELIADSD